MASGSFDGYILDGHYTVSCDWESTPDIATNTSSVKVKAWLYNDWNLHIGEREGNISINGVDTAFYSDAVHSTGWHALGEATVTVQHNQDGTKTIAIEVDFPIRATISGVYYDTITASTTAVLDNIPRYAAIQQTLESKTETTAVMRWAADKAIDKVWYSTDNGTNWTEVSVVGETGGTYTITGLTANTAYQIKTRVRSRETQLTSDSAALEVTTYDYPHAISMPDFVIGNAVTIGIYNPLGRSVRVAMIATDNTSVASVTTNGTSATGFNGAVGINLLYDSIPNAQSAQYSIRVSYGSIRKNSTGGTYTINPSKCLPEIGTAIYQDVNGSILPIMGDNQKIVRNKSIVQYTAIGVIGRKGASVASCTVTVNGNTYTLTLNGATATGGNAAIDSAMDVQAVFTVTDSRGLTATKSITIDMYDWYVPSALISLNRQSNFYSQTNITVDARYAYVDGKNSIYIQYKARERGTTSWTVIGSLQDNVQGTFVVDNTKEWEVQILLTDSFGGSVTYNLTLPKGMPIIFFDTQLSSVGIGCFPTQPSALEATDIIVNGKRLVFNQDGTVTWTAV